MERVIYLDLGTKEATDSLGGSAVQWPTLTYGEQITLGVRFAQTIDGTPFEVSKGVSQIKASIGNIDHRPESGKFKVYMKLGTGTATSDSADIDFDATASEFATAINAIAPSALGTGTVDYKDGSWFISFPNETVSSYATPYSITATTTNSLFPISFVRHRTEQRNGKWTHEIRLIQAPVSSTSVSSVKLPDPPTITSVTNGGSATGAEWNEIQALNIPAAFRGTYQIARGYKRTEMLDATDGAQQIEEALNANLVSLGESFSVTNPTDNVAHIEFKGDMQGADQALLTVTAFEQPAGDRTFTLDLDKPELSALLRRAESITLPIEIEGTLQDDDDSSITYVRTLYQGEVEIVRELHWEELSSAANINWLKPPLPDRYIPYDYSQVQTGNKHYSAAIGDASATSFVLNHNLNTDKVNVIVRENTAGGKILTVGTDFDAAITNANSVTVTALNSVTPGSGAWAVTVLGLAQDSVFTSHTHTISEITDLQTTLNSLGTRLTSLETLSGGSPLPTSSTGGEKVCDWSLPELFEVYPSRTTIPNKESIQDIEDSDLPRARGLLPAIQDTAAANLSTILTGGELPAASSHTGAVFTNNTSANFVVPGSYGHKNRTVAENGFIASDGRSWYEVEQEYTSSGETHYYPSAFERELFKLHINEKQLRLRKTFELLFGIELGLLNSNTEAQWVLRIEMGQYNSITSNSPGLNISNITWNTTPWLEQRIIIMPTVTTHTFGIRVQREMISSADTITPKARLYGALQGGLSAPSSANFAIKAKLGQFDTIDSVSDPTGFVALKGLSLEGSEDEEEASITPIGTAIIT